MKRLRCDIAISRRRERGGSLGWAYGACDCRYAISRYRIGGDGGVNRLETRRLRSPIADFAMSHRRERVGKDLHESEMARLRCENDFEGGKGKQVGAKGL